MEGLIHSDGSRLFICILVSLGGLPQGGGNVSERFKISKEDEPRSLAHTHKFLGGKPVCAMKVTAEHIQKKNSHHFLAVEI